MARDEPTWSWASKRQQTKTASTSDACQAWRLWPVPGWDVPAPVGIARAVEGMRKRRSTSPWPTPSGLGNSSTSQMQNRQGTSWRRNTLPRLYCSSPTHEDLAQLGMQGLPKLQGQAMSPRTCLQHGGCAAQTGHSRQPWYE